MEIKKLESILDSIRGTSIREVEIESGNKRIKIIRNPEPKKIKKSKDKLVEQIVTVAAPKEDSTKDIVSPKVGYVHRQKKKGDPTFVKLREIIKVGQVVAIIKSMNLEHEVASPVEGKLVEILVENGQPVEFGQPIMRLKVDDLTNSEGDNK